MATTTSAVIMVWAGTLTDRFRVRALGPTVLFGLSLACLVMSFANSWAALVLAIFMLRFFGQGMSSHVGMVAMARWFVAQRGKAIAIAALGYAVGEATLPLLFVRLLDVFSWRTLWIVGAILVLCLVPVIRALLRMERTPQSSSLDDNTLGMGGKHWTRMETLKHPLFWFVFPAIIGPSAWLTALFFQQIRK